MNKNNPCYSRKIISIPQLLLLIGCIAFNSCSDSEKEEDKSFAFLVKVLNYHLEDITPGEEIQALTLFIFDENDKFLEKRTVSMTDITAKTLYNHHYKDQSHITVVGWGNTGNNAIITIEEPKYGSPISDLKIDLISSEAITQSREFILFHGMQKILPDAQNATVIEMKRVLGTLCVSYLPRNMENKGSEYTCRITGFYNALDYKGEATGESTEYILPLNPSSDNQWQSEKAYLIPGEFKAELYENDQLIYTCEKDNASNENLRIIAGMNTILLFGL